MTLGADPINNGGAANVDAAITRRFGSSVVDPDHLSSVQLDRYYSTGAFAGVGQSAAAWVNAVIVKFLVETVEPWFQ